MYKESFGLCTAPFDLNTDPRFLYLSPDHARAQAYLEYAVLKGDSLVVITGEIGVGKSTLIHDLSDRIYKDSDVVVLHHPHSSMVEFLQAVVFEWGCKKPAATKVELLSQIRSELAARFAWGTRTTLIIDEAQTLTAEVLEELRMVADEEIESEKPLSIVLVGQPCLNATLAGPHMEQFRQRIRLSFHLPELDQQGTKAYIQRRLDIAGADSRQIFLDEAIPRIFKYTGGVPRLINVLADLSLTAAWMDKSHKVTALQVNDAIKELGWVPYSRRRRFLFAMPGIKSWGGRVSGYMDRTTQHLYLLWKNVALTAKQLLGGTMVRAARLRDMTWTRFFRWAKPRLVRIYSSRFKVRIAEHKNIVASGRQSIADVMHNFRNSEEDSTWLNPSAVRGAMVGFCATAAVGLALVSPANVQFSEAKLAVVNAPDLLLPEIQQLALTLLPGNDAQQTPAFFSALTTYPATENWLQVDTNLTTRTAVQASSEPAYPELLSTSFSDPDEQNDEEQKLKVYGLQTAHWLLEQNPDRYVIQILAAKKVDVVDRFLRTAIIDRDIALYRHQRNQEQWYVLVKSVTYPSYHDARQASQNLPKRVLKAKPWIRPVNDVQADIRKASKFEELLSMR